MQELEQEEGFLDIYNFKMWLKIKRKKKDNFEAASELKSVTTLFWQILKPVQSSKHGVQRAKPQEVPTKQRQQPSEDVSLFLAGYMTILLPNIRISTKK